MICSWTFCAAGDSLAKAHRPEVAQKLAGHFREKLAHSGTASATGEAATALSLGADGENQEEYLERIYLTYQQRAQD